MTEGNASMENMFIYFLGVVAFNSFISFIAFSIAFYIRIKKNPISWVRGTTVFFFGWILGSLITFLIHLTSDFGGFTIENSGSLEAVISLGVSFLIMFKLFDLFIKQA